MTDPGGEAAEGLAVEAYVGDTRCNAGEPLATYRALEDGRAVTRYYASVAHADQLAGCATAGSDVTFRSATARSWRPVPGTTPPTPGRRSLSGYFLEGPHDHDRYPSHGRVSQFGHPLREPDPGDLLISPEWLYALKDAEAGLTEGPYVI